MVRSLGKKKQIVINEDAERLTASQTEKLKRIFSKRGEHRIVSAGDYAQLEKTARRAKELEAENRELGQRPSRESYAQLQEKAATSEANERTLQQELFNLRPLAEEARRLKPENQRLANQISNLGHSNEQLASELAIAKEESRRRGALVENVLQRYLGFYRRFVYGNPPQGTVVAICSSDVGGVIASAQLRRSETDADGIKYAMPENWHEWLPRLKTRESRTRLPVRGEETREVITREVVIVGFYALAEEARRNLEDLYNNGVSVVVITDKQDIQLPSFVSVYYGISLPQATSEYLERKGSHDAVIDILSALWEACKTGNTEEGRYLRDSFYDPTDERYIRGVATPLSQFGTTVGSSVHDGIVRRATNYRALQRDGFNI